MHCRNVILLALVLLPAAIAFRKPTTILDLLSWDLNEESEAEKREDDSGAAGAQRSCSCDGPACMCCVDFNITFVDLGGPGCVHMKYVSQEDGIAVNVSYGESLLHSGQVKGPNPEPTCMSLLANLAQVCARFSDLHPNRDGLKGCLQLEPKLLGGVQAQFDLGCFTIGPEGMKMDQSSKNLTIATLLVDNSNTTKNGTQAEQEELNEEELIAAVNETAEQGLVFFGNWLGLFGRPDVNVTNPEAPANEAAENSSVTSDASRKARVSLVSRQNLV